MVSFKLFLVTSLLAVFAAIAGHLAFSPRFEIPPHLLGHPVHFEEGFLSETEAKDLLALVKEMSVFPTNAADNTFYKAKHEHVGEAQPLTNGKCDNPFLVPNPDRTLCVLPGRLDVAKHFILTGGPDGLKDPYVQMASRVQSFGRYMFKPEEYPVAEALFKSENFVNAGRSTCPKSKPYLDAFQFNFIIQVPGQSVAAHIDAPYFWGATRFEFPQWLLAAMVFSGMWEDKFVDQIQIVAYLHEWNNSRDGDFVYWARNDPTPQLIPSHARAGSAVDGSKTVHAASVYQLGQKAPVIDKSKTNLLTFVGDEKWILTTDNATVREYPTDDLRITIVYRARCFADEAEATRFRELPEDDKMKLEDILDTFQKDLARRGKLPSADKKDRPSPLDFAMMINKEYIKYPLSNSALIPYNYCAAGSLFPILNPLLEVIC